MKDIKFVNDLVGFLLRDSAAPVGSIKRTWDGGYTWENVDTPTNSGLNALHACDANTVFAVGEANSGTGVIIEAS